MVELPIVGFCLAAINFVISTIPNVVKLGHNIESHRSQIIRLRDRLEACNIEYSKLCSYSQTLNVYKEGSRFSQRLEDLLELQKNIVKKIEKQLSDEIAPQLWATIKEQLQRGQPKISRHRSLKLWNAVNYGLWQKDLLEGWIKELEGALKVDEIYSRRELELETANYFNKAGQQTSMSKLKRLKAMIHPLWELARELHCNCMKPDDTHDWALCIRHPYPEHDDISHWEFNPEVHLELRFSKSYNSNFPGLYKYCIDYNYQDPSTHTFKSNVQERIIDGNQNASSLSSKTHSSHVQNPLYWLSASLERMEQSARNVFNKFQWQIFRASAVFGISNWALLLWDTPWFNEICSSKLATECTKLSSLYGQPWLIEPPLSQCCHGRHDSKFQDLGIFIAELLLDIPIRSKMNHNKWEYEYFVDGEWETIFESNIGRKIYAATSSKQLRQVVQFCLDPDSRDESLRLDKNFEEGHLFICIERIHEPVKEWHKMESIGLAGFQAAEEAAGPSMANPSFKKGRSKEQTEDLYYNPACAKRVDELITDEIGKVEISNGPRSDTTLRNSLHNARTPKRSLKRVPNFGNLKAPEGDNARNL